MSNSTRTFDELVQSQASKEVTANAMFDALSQASVYGRRESTCVGLYWGYYGGNVTKADGTMAQIANSTLLLTASTTQYVVAKKTDGVVSNSSATTNWNNLAEYWRLYSVVVGTATITSYTDYRQIGEITSLCNWDAAMFYPGAPTPSAIVAQIVFARAVTMPGNLTGSAAYGKTSATASTVFDIKKNNSSTGSITFAGAANVATFSTTAGAALSFAIGDRLEVVAPASPDATLADVSFSLIGNR